MLRSRKCIFQMHTLFHTHTCVHSSIESAEKKGAHITLTWHSKWLCTRKWTRAAFGSKDHGWGIGSTKGEWIGVEWSWGSGLGLAGLQPQPQTITKAKLSAVSSGDSCSLAHPALPPTPTHSHRSCSGFSSGRAGYSGYSAPIRAFYLGVWFTN